MNVLAIQYCICMTIIYLQHISAESLDIDIPGTAFARARLASAEAFDRAHARVTSGFQMEKMYQLAHTDCKGRIVKIV